MGNGKIHATISQNKGTKQVKNNNNNSCILVAVEDRKRIQQPTVKAERDKKYTNE